MKKTWFAFFVLGLCVISIAFLYGCGSNATGGGGGGGGGGGAAVYTLTLSVSTESPTSETVGTIEAYPSAEGNNYSAGAVVELSAISLDPDYMFSSWEGSISGETSPVHILVYGDKNILARFRSTPLLGTTYTLNAAATPDTYGSIIQSGLGTYDAGTVIILTAEAYPGYIFDHWSGDLNGSSNPTTLTMNGIKHVTAVYRPINKYALNITVSPGSSGTVGQSGTSPYDEGTVVTVTAEPTTGYYFDHWGGALSGSTNPATITMDATKDVTAVFKVIPTIPGDSTIYDGTYMGQFAYVYYTYGGLDPVTHLQIWNAQSTGFQLTVTLHHIAGAGGSMALNITHVTCSDTNFGTGTGGIAPSFGSAAVLPTSIPITPSNPSTAGQGLVILLPNGSTIGTTNTAGALNVTSDGRILSNTLAVYGDAWIPEYPDNSPFPPDPGPAGRPPTEFKSWSLTKQ